MKLFLIIVLEIIIAIPLFIGFWLLLGVPMQSGGMFFVLLEVITTTALFSLSLYLALLILSKKFTPEDIGIIPTRLLMIYLAFGIVSFLTGGFDVSLVSTLIFYPVVAFFLSKQFLKRRLRIV